MPSEQADAVLRRFGVVPKIDRRRTGRGRHCLPCARLCESRRCELRRLPPTGPVPARPPHGPVRGRPRDRPGEGRRPALGTDRGPDREREHHRLPGVAEGDPGPGVRRLPRPVGVVGDRDRGVLADDLGLPRHHRRRASDGGLRRAPDDARRRVVPRRDAQLRRERDGPRGAGRGRALLPLGDRSGHPAALGRPGGEGPDPGDPAATPRRPAGRPRRLDAAEHPRGRHRHARGHVDRGYLDERLPRLRLARRPRPVPSAPAERADLHRRLPLQRQGLRPQRRAPADRRRPGLPGARHLPAVRRRPGPGRQRRELARAARPRAGVTRRVQVSPRSVRDAALDSLLQRHHRTAESDHPQPRRHPPRAAEAAAPEHEPQPRRRAVLLHHHRLDDVELPGQLARAGGEAAALRRQPGLPRAGRAVADGGAGAGDAVRRVARLRGHARQAGRGAQGQVRPVGAAVRDAGRLAGLARGLRLVPAQRQARPVAARGQRRHRRAAPASPAARRRCRSTRASTSTATSASPPTPSTNPGNRSWTRSARWSSPGRCRRCR